jgi:hypothetical protein
VLSAAELMAAEGIDATVSIERFGASAPGARVMAELGITAEAVATRARELIGGAEALGEGVARDSRYRATAMAASMYAVPSAIAAIDTRRSRSQTSGSAAVAPSAPSGVIA